MFIKLAQMVPLPYSRGRSTRYSDRLHDIVATISRCYKNVYTDNLFLRTARLWNSLSFLGPLIQMTLRLELTDTP